VLLTSGGTLLATSQTLAPGRQHTSCDSLSGRQMDTSVPLNRVTQYEHSSFLFVVSTVCCWYSFSLQTFLVGVYSC